MWPNFDPDSMAAYYAEAHLNDEDYDYDSPTVVRCKYCHKDGFYWGSTESGWRLFTAKGNLHSCANGRTPKFRIGGKIYGL